MPQLDISTYSSQVFWLIVSFSLIYVLNYFIVIPKMKKLLKKRHRKITYGFVQAQKIKEEISLMAKARQQRWDKNKKECQIKRNLHIKKENKKFLQGKEISSLECQEKILEYSKKYNTLRQKSTVEAKDFSHKILKTLYSSLSKKDIL